MKRLFTSWNTHATINSMDETGMFHCERYGREAGFPMADCPERQFGSCIYSLQRNRLQIRAKGLWLGSSLGGVNLFGVKDRLQLEVVKLPGG